MDSHGLDRVEELCAIVYGGKQVPQNTLAEAHKVLLALQTGAIFLPQVQYLLSNAKTPLSLLYGINSVYHIVNKDWNNIPSNIQTELVPFFLSFLADSQQTNVTFIRTSALRCLCRIVREGWLANKSFHGIFEQIKKFLESGSRAHCLLGLQILSNLVIEFDVTNSEHNNSYSTSRAVNSYGYRVMPRYDATKRLISQSFREQGLNNAFLLAIAYVDKGKESGFAEILKEALTTLHITLKFDFVGTGQESTDEGVSCLYIPMGWAENIARDKSLQHLFDIYNLQWSSASGANDALLLKKESASLSLQILISVRRSAFTAQTRRNFLIVLLKQTSILMQSKLGLVNSEDCLHHFCRLLAAIKSHFTLVDLTQPDEYQQWLTNLATFTTNVLEAWSTVSNRTVHYLIKLWASLVLPTPYLQARDGLRTSNSSTVPPYLRGLDVFVPQIVRQFIHSRCEMCSSAPLDKQDGAAARIFDKSAFFGAENDILDEEGLLVDDLSPVAILVRFKFTEALNEIQKLYNDALTKYQNILGNMNQLTSNHEASKVFHASQAVLTFLNYLIGSIIGSHVSRVSAAVIDSFDQTNVELASLVFSLINTMNSLSTDLLDISSDTGYKLEMSCLYFVKSFQNLYIESRARIEADKDRFDGMDLPFPYPNIMYDGIRGSRTPVQRNSMEEEDNTAAKSESQLQRLQEDINNRFGSSVLDMALQKVFALLSQMTSNWTTEENLSSSNKSKLTEKALSVLHQLSIGVTVVHAGRNFAPKLMSSGKLLLESKTIQNLLISPEARNFPLLANPAHHKSRSFLMATLAKLLFTQLRNIPSQGVVLNLSSFLGSFHTDLERVFEEINRIIFNNSSSLNNVGTNSIASSERSHYGGEETAELVLVSGDGVITINNVGGNMLSGQKIKGNVTDNPIFNSNFYQKRAISRQEVCDILFVQFMKPLETSFEAINQILQQSQPNQTDINNLKNIVLVLFRDLKGVLSSCAIAREYELLFSWLFPKRIKSLTSIANIFWAEDDIILRLFKFLKHLVHNRGSRISFGSTYSVGNVAGYVLVQETCAILLAYIRPKSNFFNEYKSTQAQRHKSNTTQDVSNENIMRDLLIITGVKAQGNGAKPNGMQDASINENFLSMNALKEAVMNIETSSPTESFAITTAKKRISSSNKNAINLDFGVYGLGVTVSLTDLEERFPGSKTVKILYSIVQIACRIISGRFANLSCFEIYNDSKLKDMIKNVLAIAFIAEPYEILNYPKLTINIVELIYVLCNNPKYILVVVENDSGLLARIIATLAEVINIEDNFGSNNGKVSNSLEEVVTDVSNVSAAENSVKFNYMQYKAIVGKAATALHNLVVLRCRAVAFNYVKNQTGNESIDHEAAFNTKLSFLSLDLRSTLHPSYRSSFATNVNTDQAFTQEMLSMATGFFAMHNENMPKLFSELLTLVLSKIFILPNNIETKEEMDSNTETKSSRYSRDSYSLRGNSRKIAKLLLPLILTAPHTFEQFKAKVLAVYAQNNSKIALVEEQFTKLFHVLQPAITRTTSNLGVAPNPAFFEPLLKENENFSKEICNLAKMLSIS